MRGNGKGWRRVTAFLIVMVMTASFVLPVSAAGDVTDAIVVVDAHQDLARQVLDLVNQEREKDHLAPLKMVDELEEAALWRATECQVLFSHTRPDGTACFSVSSELGIEASAQGENIAGGMTTPQAAMQAWMNSEGHRANILDPGYTHIGIGCVEQGGHYTWVQYFATLTDPSQYTEIDEEPLTQSGILIGVQLSPSAIEQTMKDEEQPVEFGLSSGYEDDKITLTVDDGENGGAFVFPAFLIYQYPVAYIIGDDVSYSGIDSDIVSLERASSSGLMMIRALKPGETVVNIAWDGMTTQLKVSVQCNHEYIEEVRLATCVEKGVSKQVCKHCGDEKDVVEIPALGHDKVYTTTKQANCTEEGTREVTCSRCDWKETETIPALGHDFSGEWTVVRAADCTTAGEKTITCAREGCDETKSETIPALGHEYGEWKVTKEATFTEDGEEARTCTRCGKAETRRIPKRSEGHEHSFTGDEEIIVSASCITEGKKLVHCSEKDCTAVKEFSIEKTAHTPGDWITVTGPTCTEEGLKHTVCTVCGAEIDTMVLPAKGHTWGDWEVVKEADCTEEGSREHTCQVCGLTVEESIPAKGHTPGEWQVVTEPTCVEEGLKHIVCTVCNAEVETASIAAKGHTVEEWKITKEATYEAEGEREGLCEICGETITESIPKLAKPAVSDTDDKKGEQQIGNAVSQNKDQNNTTGKVQTGDGANMILYVGLLLAAGSAAAVILRRRVRN